MNDETEIGANTELEDLIRQIKQAVVDAESDLKNRQISVEKIDLELNSILKEKPGGKFEFEWGPIKIGGGTDLTNDQVTKIKLTIAPEESELELMAPKIQKGLSAAIKLILDAVDHANATSPPFDFKNGSIDLSFGISTEAELKIMGLGVSALESETQKIVLHLKANE